MSRKTWLFVGLSGGSKTSAIAFSLTENAKLNGVDSQAKLSDILGRIGDHKDRPVVA